MTTPSTVVFTDRATAHVRAIQSLADLPGVLESVALSPGRPTLVVIGGASRLSEEDFQRVQSLFVKVLAPIAQRYQAVVVDGGTDAGVMRLMGQARAELGATFPLVGVSPIGLSLLPDESALNQGATAAEAAPLEPHHTHFFLVPGDQWGDEAAMLAQIASVIAADAPSITVLVNGGEITWQDAAESVEVGRSILVVAGTGRTADIIAAAVQGETRAGEVPDPRAAQLIKSGLVGTISLSEDPAILTQIISQTFAKS